MKFAVWTLNRRVYENILQLKQDYSEAISEMLDHLTHQPYQSKSRKYFKLVQYHAWEYKLPRFNRIYCKVYLLDGQKRVLIYHAGCHPNEGVPQPPDDDSIDWTHTQDLSF